MREEPDPASAKDLGVRVGRFPTIICSQPGFAIIERARAPARVPIIITRPVHPLPWRFARLASGRAHTQPASAFTLSRTLTHTEEADAAAPARGVLAGLLLAALFLLSTLSIRLRSSGRLRRPPPPRAPVPGLRRATHPPCGPLTRAGSIPTRHRTRTLRFLPDLAAHPNVLLLVSSRSRSPDFRALLSSPLEESREKVADPTRGRQRVEEPRLGRVGRGERSERGKWVK